MDLKALMETEAQAVLADLRTRADGMLAKVTHQDRELIERSLARAAVLHASLLLNPEDAAAKSELASVVNSLRFLEAAYGIAAAREVREFINSTVHRVSTVLLNIAIGALA
jgi:hypothetical protein